MLIRHPTRVLIFWDDMNDGWVVRVHFDDDTEEEECLADDLWDDSSASDEVLIEIVEEALTRIYGADVLVELEEIEIERGIGGSVG